ncbi:ARPC5, partial [Cordylochernes scorpioides]
IIIMSKNTSSSAFRKIDIDQYNDDCYKDEDVCDPVSSPTGPDEKEEVEQVWLKSFRKLPVVPRFDKETQFCEICTQSYRKSVDALKMLLKSAPLGSRNQAAKDSALCAILRVLLAIKTNEIERAVSSLDTDLLDVLMKYIYKGFEKPVENSSGHLLIWHEKTYAAGGLGCIVRVLTDKKEA